MRTPPIAGPQATFSIAAIALSRQPNGNVNELERAKLVGKAKCVLLQCAGYCFRSQKISDTIPLTTRQVMIGK